MPDDVLKGATHHQREQIRALFSEKVRREQEALRMYEPTKLQERFHASKAKEVLIQAGNQFGKANPLHTKILTPDGWTTMGELSVGDVIIGGDGKPCDVTHIHPRGELEVYRVEFDDGSSAECCGDHLWKCRTGKERYRDKPWQVRSLNEIIEKGGLEPSPTRRTEIPTVGDVEFNEWETPIDPYLLGVLIGDGGLSGHSVHLTSPDEEILAAVSRALPEGVELVAKKKQYDYGVARTAPSGPNAVMDRLRELGLWGKKSVDKFIPPSYLFNSTQVRLAILQGLMDTDGSCGKTGAVEYSTSSDRLADDVVFLVQSLGGKVKRTRRMTRYTKPDGTKSRKFPSHRLKVRLPRHPNFRLKRKQDRYIRPTSTTDNRVLYKITPLGKKPCQCITVNSHDSTYVVDDFIVTHNSMAAFIEDARALTGQDPHKKYPKENGVLVCIGMDEGHIGRVIHRYFFEPGIFRLIKDPGTKKTRAWKPWLEYDAAYKEKAFEAPPLIEDRFVKGKVNWKDRGKKVFDNFEMINGWKCMAFGSKGEPAAGFQADIVHIDEDIDDPNWYDEMIARLTMRNGKMRWSALPLARNDALINVAERAKDEASSKQPSTVVIKATVFDNPYMDEKTRQENIKRWKAKGEDEYRKRALGELTIDSVLVYPTFDVNTHGAVVKYDEAVSNVQKLLSRQNGKPPDNWCHYMSVDPGHKVCAVTFFAVPPPSLGDHVVLYDELYLEQCDAPKFGRNVANKVGGKNFEAFIIDAHGGRLRELGTGVLPRERYSKELRDREVFSRKTRSGFLSGSDDIAGREGCLREWLNVRPDGTTKLLVVAKNCPNTCREFTRFKKKRASNGFITDVADRSRYCHAIETIEYAAAYGLPYVKPKSNRVSISVFDRILDGRRERKAKREAKYGKPQNTISLGPRGV